MKQDQDPDQPGLEVAPSDAPIAKGPEFPDLQVAPSDAPIVYTVDHSELEVATEVAEVERSTEDYGKVLKPNRICGLSVVTFWLLLALGIIIIGAVVGGGVGGSLANKKLRGGDVAASTKLAPPGTTPPASASTTATTNSTANVSSTTSQMLAPAQSPPPGCSLNYDGSFQIKVQSVSASNKRELDQRKTDLVMTLKNGTLIDQEGRTGYVASNSQVQFHNPAPADAIWTGGFSVCQDARLALGNSVIWYRCKREGSYNIYFYNVKPAGECGIIYVAAIPIGSGGPVPASASSSSRAPTLTNRV